MKIINFELPKDVLEILYSSMGEPCIRSSEETRLAIREIIREEFLSGYENYSHNIQLEIKKRKISSFYDYCINCNKRLHSNLGHFRYKNMNIYELRFCCDCFEKFKGKTLEEFPDSIIEKINKKVKDFRKCNRKDLD